jgi:pyridoxine/pyridoxamine 5'-phosphate oxidase
MDMKRIAKAIACVAFILVSSAMTPGSSQAQEKKPAPDRASMIASARELMATQTYRALITIDSDGRPSVRTMNPFPPEEDMSVCLATNDRSRKVQEIRKDPRVTLYYANHKEATG